MFTYAHLYEPDLQDNIELRFWWYNSQ